MTRARGVPESVHAFLAAYPPQVRAIALRLRRLLLQLIPDATEHVYTGWKIISYRTGEGHANQICYIAPHNGGVNLGFERGARLPDPDRLLTGTAKYARNVRIRKPGDIAEDALTRLVEAAVHAYLIRIA